MRERLIKLAQLSVIFFLFAGAAFANCPVERGQIKMGEDKAANDIALEDAKSTTIAQLIGVHAPKPIPKEKRVAPLETSYWEIEATLTDYALEDDADFHLVLEDDSGNTMIAEIPDPDCVDTESPFYDGIKKARDVFNKRLSPTSKFQTANIK